MFARLGIARLTLALTIGLATAPGAIAAQEDSEEWLEDCRDRYDDDDRDHYCELKEQRMPATGSLNVDGRQNGGITVRGWDQRDVLVRARIQTWARTEERAKEMAGEITIEATDGRVRATGPTTERRSSWSVSYEIFVPRSYNLSLETYNGGIRVRDVRGRMDLSAHNGGLHLDGVGGDVRGSTTNGGLHVELEGQKWEGEGLDLRTTNGGVSMTIPSDYSATLETGTVNGGMSIDFPITVQGRITRRLTTQLGSGGPTIRAITTNGGVRIRRG